MVRKTKIVATIGPSTEKVDMLRKLIKSGLNVARVNFSHGNHAEQGRKIEAIKEASRLEKQPIAILQDLCGPKIRLGDFTTPTILLREGSFFSITTEEIVGDETRAFINYKPFSKEVRVGQKVLLDDGRRALEIVSIKGSEVKCRIQIGGEIKGRRGVSVPEATLSIETLTDKDRKDVRFGVSHKVDFVALSFVRSAQDVVELRALLKTLRSKAGIIAKIETPQAVADIDAIIKEADGIMIARGDMAVEMSPEDVPLVQKRIIQLCNRFGKPVITATQMLDSMIRSSTPTRAEVSDIANAVLDGTDALMLSEESALGAYPIEAIGVMHRVALRIESDYLHRKLLKGKHRTDGIHDVADSITASAIETADAVQARAIVALTMSGFTARMLSRHKGQLPIVAMTPTEEACRKLSLSFGCQPVHITSPKNFEGVMRMIRKHFVAHKLASRGDKLVVVSGLPFGTAIQTNMVLVEEV